MELHIAPLQNDAFRDFKGLGTIGAPVVPRVTDLADFVTCPQGP